MFGLSVAIATPFDKDDKIEVNEFRNQISNLLTSKIDSITFFGTTGEGPSISFSEKIQTLEYLLSYELTPKQIYVSIIQSNYKSAQIEIDKYKFNYSDKWELINRSDKSITLQGTDSNFVFNISETPSSQIVDFTSYLIQSSDLNLLSKKILSDYVGYIIEAEDKDNNIHKIITMSSVHNELIILSIISSKQNWELNSELFDLTFQSLLANPK